jgi:uncharacterized metal-binding protein YceD (DUF177 family)
VSSKFNQYYIYFSGLKDGKHNFGFKVDKTLFSLYGDQEIIDAKVSIDAVLEKKLNHLSFGFNIVGTVLVACDRCLGDMTIEINYSPVLYVNFGEASSDITDIDDTMVLSRAEGKIDLSKHFYDYIILNIPIQKLHPDDEMGNSTCNPEMLKNLDKYSVKEGEKDKTDPRWDSLKNLYN